MKLGNTGNSYGIVSRVLHWLTALVVLTAFPLGLLANNQDLTTNAGIQAAFLLFSFHKTTGILAFIIGVVRLFWTLSQPRPAPLHPDRAVENFAAGTVHWTLTIALIVVPLAGWLSHAAATGLAPIWWPLGQSLPFVPKDAALSEQLAAIHRIFTNFLLAAVLLHIAGAIKHLLVDRDDVFARIWRGTSSGPMRQYSNPLPVFAAVVIWASALAAGLLLETTQTSQSTMNVREWPLADAELALVGDSGEILATANAFQFLLVMDAESPGTENGTLDLAIPLDVLEGPGAEKILSATPFPLLQFLGTVGGTPPSLSATGLLTSGDLTQDAEFQVVIDSEGARVEGASPIPGSPDINLTIDAFALRP